MNARTRVMLAILALAAAAVVIDRYVIKAAPDEDAGVAQADTARARYLALAETVARKRSLIEAEPEFREAVEQARRRWGEIRDRLVTAPSASLAEAQFRDDVLQFARRRDVPDARTSRIESTPLAENERIRLIELDLELSTPGVPDVYRLIDALENMPGTLTNVAAVDISGPGRIPREPVVQARITIQAIAQIEGGG